MPGRLEGKGALIDGGMTAGGRVNYE